MKKRTLLLIDALSQGGAEKQLVLLASGLKGKGYDVKLTTYHQIENFYERDLKRDEISLEVIPSGKSKIKGILGLRNLIKDWHPDIVICFKDGPSMLACLTRLTCKFNLVVSERNTTQSLSKKEKLKFFLYRLADFIIPNSQSQASFIAHNYPNLSSKVFVINNMVDLEIFKPSHSKGRNGIPKIVTLARINPQKNILNYLETVAEVKRRGISTHFNWYGRVDSDVYWEKVKKKIIELDIDDYVSFHAPVNNPSEIYNQSDIFLLPSIYEGFPNVLCEAMACGLPAIASAVNDSKVILSDHEWLVDPHDPINMADTICRMLNLPLKEREEIGKNNHEAVKYLCAKEVFLDNYQKLIEKNDKD